MARKGKPKRTKPDRVEKNLHEGIALVRKSRVFYELELGTRILWAEPNEIPPDGYALVTGHGSVRLRKQLLAPEEWAYVIGHCLLHLGFEHWVEKDDPQAWNLACCAVVATVLASLKFGRAPEGVEVPQPARNERVIYEQLLREEKLPPFSHYSIAGSRLDMVGELEQRKWDKNWADKLADGLTAALSETIDKAGGGDGSPKELSVAARARRWFIDSYPLLGALAASFELIEQPEVCRREEVGVAAVSELTQEIYLNPAAGLIEDECRFVIAHELLHVGLRHTERQRGRDPFLWNAACDFVINGWLVEMNVGSIPARGCLYDPELAGLSAEDIYDQLTKNLRRARKLATLRGVAACDMFRPRGHSDTADHQTLDDFFRRSLIQGFDFHDRSQRGLLPSGLVEAIRALSHPPIPWDVELAKWFDRYFAPIEKRRSFARPSRRQASTPDIARPSWVVSEGAEDARTFGVVLDTSGSMDRALLGKALGAIASYSMSRDVPYARVVFCDAAAYDAGYMSPEAIAGRVRLKGRGGTVLQPGIDLLERAADFPKTGPLLIITDGYCDILRLRRDHAYLMPEHARLPFKPRGPVFRLGEKT